MASIGSQGVASSAISSFSGSFPLGTSSARQGLFSLQEGSACSPVIVSVSMAPQVRDSQVLEWTGRLMPWKGEASRRFSTSLNIVSEDVLPTLHTNSPLLGHARKKHFQLCAFRLAPCPFQTKGTGECHCKDILHTYAYQSLYLI